MADFFPKTSGPLNELYEALFEHCDASQGEEARRSLSRLGVRLAFCLCAEAYGLFHCQGALRTYLENSATSNFSELLVQLFRVLGTPKKQRPHNLEAELMAFPYVSGGLFKEVDDPPLLGDSVRTVFLNHTRESYAWGDLPCTVLGDIFESALSPSIRRQGGIHYTNIENIHKLIGPLFLDDLKSEFIAIKTGYPKSPEAKIEAFKKFQQKLSCLTFLDPACGAGSFLVEAYISLRHLENEVIKELKAIGTESNFPISVSLSQFYGLELHTFAAATARATLWLAEGYLQAQTQHITGPISGFQPFTSRLNIHEGNALRLDWAKFIAPANLNYIMGNPPFVGHQWRSKEQVEDMRVAFPDLPRHGKLDYVCAWYATAATYMQGTSISAAFVSTNSICQGESVGILWPYLIEKKHVEIQFAHTSFAWSGTLPGQAAVYVVIVGFGQTPLTHPRKLYSEGHAETVPHINGFLINAPDIFIKARGRSLSGLPKMSKGSQATDGGWLIMSSQERDELLNRYIQAAPFVRRFASGEDYVNNKIRYCLWLEGVPSQTYSQIPPIMERLRKVTMVRSQSPTASVRSAAQTPALFTQIRQPSTPYLAVPVVSSHQRRYIPIGYLPPDIIGSDQIYIIPNAGLYLFGVLISSLHMTWTSIFAGRLGLGFRYSPAIYNNFPWLCLNPVQRADIETSALAILKARALYPDRSLAALYNDQTMPPELKVAHQANDLNVMQAYGFKQNLTEAESIARLIELYRKQVGY